MLQCIFFHPICARSTCAIRTPCTRLVSDYVFILAASHLFFQASFSQFCAPAIDFHLCLFCLTYERARARHLLAICDVSRLTCLCRRFEGVHISPQPTQLRENCVLFYPVVSLTVCLAAVQAFSIFPRRYGALLVLVTLLTCIVSRAMMQLYCCLPRRLSFPQLRRRWPV